MKQNKMLIADGKILYSVVKEAIKEAGYSLQSKNINSVLVWYDNLRETDFYSTLKPWQVVNRIPFINLICRKAPFIQLMNRMKVFFPSLYTFHPLSMILPVCNNQFQKLVSNHDKKYIVKPDNGSLGCGITILSKNSIFKPIKNLCVAQEYIDSYLIDETKFDLRVYALVSSVTPLQIYVYHDGIARFCSEKSTVNNIFSQLTNTAVNRNNPNAKIESITKTIFEVFQILEQKGVDTGLIWSKIENAVILTILPAINYMKFGVSQKGLSKGYNRCFQILGFDFILDNDLNPFILEVNYRPSLDTDTEAERKLKTKMLGTAMHIGAPLESLQKIINENNEIINFSKEKWDIFYKKISEKLPLIDKNVDTGLFNLVYPSKSVENTKTYNEVLNIVNRCPIKLTPHYKLPVPLKRPDPSLLPKVNPIIFYSNNQEIDDSNKQAGVKPNQKEHNQQKLLDKNNVEFNLIQNDQQKNLAKLKHIYHEKRDQNGSLNNQICSTILSENLDVDDNLYVRKIIEEIELMKELNSNDPITDISKCKQTTEHKNILHKKSVVSSKPHNLRTASNPQKNIIKNSNIPDINAKGDGKVQAIKISEEEKLPQPKAAITINSNNVDPTQKENLNQNINESQNQNINESKTKEITVKNKDIISKNSNTVQKINRTRRSASTKPIMRTIQSTEQSKINNSIKNYHNIEEFSKKYIEIITDKIKQDLNYTPNLNPKQIKSPKVSKRNNTTKTSIDAFFNYESESNKAQLSKSTTVVKTKKAVKKSNGSNENLKNNHMEAEKQPQQKQPVAVNSTKTNLSQNTVENSKTSTEKEVTPTTQEIGTRIRLKPKPNKIEKNTKQNDKDEIEIKKLKIEDNPKADIKQSQETTELKPKQKIESKVVNDQKYKIKYKLKPEYESKFKVNNKTELPPKIKNNTEVKIESTNKAELQIGSVKNDPKPEPAPKQQENKINKAKELEKDKINKIDTKPKIEVEKAKIIKTEPKNKKEIVRNLKTEPETKKVVKSEPKPKIENDKSVKVDSQEKNNIISETKHIIEKDQKLVKNESKPKQEVELTTKPIINEKEEFIKLLLKKAEYQKQKH